MVLKRLTTLSQFESNALVNDVTDGAFIRDDRSLFQFFPFLQERSTTTVKTEASVVKQKTVTTVGTY